MLEETLRAEAQVLHDMLGTHDTGDFMRRLAIRITQDASRPPRVGTAPSAPATTADPEDADEAPGPAAPPRSFGAQPQRSTRPRIRRHLRRRPAPLVAADPAAHPSAVFAHVRRLCDTVLRSDDVHTLLAFDSDYDQAGARTFACLLYTIDRHESALYWWRFAAGAGDPLAAHLLAAYHAAVGSVPDARVWRAFSRMLGYTEQHVPQPVRVTTRTAQGFANHAPWDSRLREFMTFDHLPDALVRH
ncbi:hypothetical protein [Streptomyces sp. NPDC056244]|uniref:hypothetical protein n=1 Tax=Streptomyces sp. NPDC056244 TaxID=3345762 RepID=UPI0035DE41DF